MIVFYCLLFLALLLYLLLILAYNKGFENHPIYITIESEETLKASILIPYRHQDERLQALLKQIITQTNGHAEIILINDFALTPISYEANPAIRSIELKEKSPHLNSNKNNKKEAISLGVDASVNEYIICLDADITLADSWWKTIASFILEKKPHFAAGLHRYLAGDGWLNKFLVLEQDILTASSIAALHLRFPTMCNGANMTFTKTAFQAVHGYNGLYHTNGGDDLFLYHRIYKKFPFATHYIKNLDGAVYSRPPKTFHELIKQRTRWISKTTSYENRSIQIQAGIILLINFLFVCGLFIFPLFPILLLKLFIDILFIFKIQNFYGFKFLFKEVLVFSILYPIYTLLVLVSYIFNIRL
jgi:biofilm PGA synthesis N-glycosyltransferase PgaC